MCCSSRIFMTPVWPNLCLWWLHFDKLFLALHSLKGDKSEYLVVYVLFGLSNPWPVQHCKNVKLRLVTVTHITVISLCKVVWLHCEYAECSIIRQLRPQKTRDLVKMADPLNPFAEEDLDLTPISLIQDEVQHGTKESTPDSLSDAEGVSLDQVAAKLLKERLLLTSLELHTELLESGREIPRLRDFFSNPGNFERTRGADTLTSPTGLRMYLLQLHIVVLVSTVKVVCWQLSNIPEPQIQMTHPQMSVDSGHTHQFFGGFCELHMIFMLVDVFGTTMSTNRSCPIPTKLLRICLGNL